MCAEPSDGLGAGDHPRLGEHEAEVRVFTADRDHDDALVAIETREEVDEVPRQHDDLLEVVLVAADAADALERVLDRRDNVTTIGCA